MKTSLKKFKYYIGLGLAALLVVSGLLTFMIPAQPAKAANASGTGAWIDRATISYKGKTFAGPVSKDGKWRYTATTDGTCAAGKENRSFIEFAANPANPGTPTSPGFLDELQTLGGSAEGGTVECMWVRNQKLTLTNVSAAKLSSVQVKCGVQDVASPQQQAAYDKCAVNEAVKQCGTGPAAQACIDSATGKTQGFENQDAVVPPAADPAAAESELDCDYVLWNPLTWVICPFVKLVNTTLNGIDAAITGLLTIEAGKIFDTSQKPGSGYYAAWQSFRSIALGLLVAGALIMIISQALGFDFLDAYTIKKIVPRLLVAIIGIALSWEIMRWFVVLTNDLGLGVRSLIYYPFTQGMGDLKDTALAGGAIVPLLAVGGFFGLGLIGLLSFGLTALIALLTAFFVLILRQLLVVVLILAAPLAIAAYILPNTQSIWKLWYENFTKALLMFPIIMAFLAVGRVFAFTAGNGGIIGQITAFVAYIIPYFMIPMTYKFAGGAMGALGGAVTAKSQPALQGLKKYRKGQWQSHGGERMQRGSDRMLQARYKAYNKMKNANGTFSKRFARVGMGAMGGFNMEEQVSAANERAQKRAGAQTANGPDSLLRAYTANKEYADGLKKSAETLRTRAESTGTAADLQAADEAKAFAAEYIRDKDGVTEYRSLGGSWQKEADVVRSKAAFGKNNHAAFQAALTYEMGKATTQEEQDHLVNAYGSATERFGMNEQQAGEVWIGSAYAKQNENRQWKHHKWETDTSTGKLTSKVKGLGMMREIDEKQGSYAMMQQNADTWTTMSQEVMTARAVLDGQKKGDMAEAQETIQRAARIAYATRSGSYADTSAGTASGDTDAPHAPIPPGVASASRPAGAGAPGRVQEEINSFLAVADAYAGKYQPPGSPIVGPVSSGPTPTHAPVGPGESLTRRDQNGR